MTRCIQDVWAEAEKARARYGDFTSAHEALGVLQEEMHELVEAIRSNTDVAVAKEAKQVSAVAFRLFELASRARDGEVTAESFRKRSGW